MKGNNNDSNKYCKVCNVSLDCNQIRDNLVCCSRRCAGILRRGIPIVINRVPRIEKNCLYCNKLFTTREKSKQKYCNKNCYYASKIGLLWGSALHPLKRIKIKCLYCNKILYIKEKDKTKFCSASCFYKYRTKPFIHVKCKQCNKIFKTKSIKSQFCSNKCRLLNLHTYAPQKARITIIKTGCLRGKNHPMYGKTFKMQEKTKLLLKKIMVAKFKDLKYYNVQMPKMLAGSLNRPTSFELRICYLCLKYNLPFVYVGDGKFLVGYKNPDFVHKYLNILIEVYNDFHHPKNYEEIRGQHFAKYGYKTIFISQKEVLSDSWETICLNKITGALQNA
jgi:endogenous inhibitor of DNA gyrase (YacG/DUF329 family)